VCVSVLKNRKNRTVTVRDVARLKFSFLLLFAFASTKEKRSPAFGTINNKMEDTDEPSH